MIAKDAKGGDWKESGRDMKDKRMCVCVCTRVSVHKVGSGVN